VPSWRHAIESEVYVARADGAWSYDAKAHRLTQILADDIRAQTGVQDFVGTAPVDLVYVADGSRLQGASADEKRVWAYTDTGFIGQNVYLFCASEGLATVFRGSLDRTRLAQTLQLPPAKFVTCVQTVGYPKA
jgi:nitroreductase